MMTARRIKELLAASTNTNTSTTKIKHVLKKDLGLSFLKVKALSLQTNSVKSVACRQAYAQEMLGALNLGYRIVNVDESWMATMTFRYRSWSETGRPNARPLKELPLRVTLIAAIDNRGASYLSIATGNTDSDVFVTYLYHLAAALDREADDWRKETLFLLDNAPYHKSDQTRAAIKKLGLRVIFSGPYSFESAPIEAWFALLKTGELNPDGVKVGKR